MKKLFYACLFIFLFSAAYGITAAAADNLQGTIVRVAIIDDKDSIALSLKGRYEISGYSPERLLMNGQIGRAHV